MNSLSPALKRRATRNRRSATKTIYGIENKNRKLINKLTTTPFAD